MEILLKINNLSGGYYKEDIVKNVCLDINQGDFIGIIGPNGSGKTTLLRLVTRVLRPNKGEVYFMGKNILEMSLKEFCRQIAFVSQETPGSFSFTVMESVLMGRTPHLRRLQFETKKDLKVTEDALVETDTLNLREKYTDELSAGERQRVVIARALAQEPILLFLDEPTAHLDIGYQIQVLDLLKKLNRDKNLTIAMVIHDLNLASTYCNRIALFNNGSIFKQGSPEQVLTYQNIEQVYKTIVLVNNNPVTHRPNVILVPKEK